MITVSAGRGEPCSLIVEAEPVARHLLHIGKRHAIGPMSRAWLTGQASCHEICVEVAEPHSAFSLWPGGIHREIFSFSGGGAALTVSTCLKR